MLLRWVLIYVQFVLIVVLGTLLYFQHLRMAAGISGVDALNARIEEQHKLLTGAEKKIDLAARDARSAADKLAEERRAREQAEQAFAEAHHELAELRKAKGTSDETARQALAQLEEQRQVRKRQATIASRRSIARAMRAARAEAERLARAAAPVAPELPAKAEAPLPAAPSTLPPSSSKKPNVTTKPVAPAPATTSSVGTAKKGTAGSPRPKAAKKPSSVWDGLF
jgi:hypothetical protein